jgi:hypothetical protein
MAPTEVSSNNNIVIPKVASLADPQTRSRADIERQQGNSSQISLDSRGSRFSERFDLDGPAVMNGAAVLAAEDTRMQDTQRKLRRKKRGIAVGGEAVAVHVSEKSGQEEDTDQGKCEGEGEKTGCTGIKAKGITGVKQFKSKVTLWTEKVCAMVRKMAGKTPNKELARNF